MVNVYGYKLDFLNDLGRGAFGTIYKGTDASGKDVAAKAILKKKSTFTTAAKESIMAWHMMINTNHPNVVKHYDVKSWESKVFIFMEYCPHGDLVTFSKQCKLPEWQHLEVMNQLAEAVKYIHKKGIVHRDIKPSNILVSNENPVVVKLADFGLSKLLDLEQSSVSEDICSRSSEFHAEDCKKDAHMSSVVGTTIFRAPELFPKDAQCRVQYSSSIDIFASGLTYLYIVQGCASPPRLETPLHESELRMPIGLVLAERFRKGISHLDVVNTDRTDSISEQGRLIRKLIQRMTRMSPEERLTADEVVRDLTAITMQVIIVIFLIPCFSALLTHNNRKSRKFSE